MIKGKYNQAKCEHCGSWHFAIQLNDLMQIVEIKCCKCKRISDPILDVRK